MIFRVTFFCVISSFLHSFNFARITNSRARHNDIWFYISYVIQMSTRMWFWYIFIYATLKLDNNPPMYLHPFNNYPYFVKTYFNLLFIQFILIVHEISVTYHTDKNNVVCHCNLCVHSITVCQKWLIHRSWFK